MCTDNVQKETMGTVVEYTDCQSLNRFALRVSTENAE
jgi:hypothetical protein